MMLIGGVQKISCVVVDVVDFAFGLRCVFLCC